MPPSSSARFAIMVLCCVLLLIECKAALPLNARMAGDFEACRAFFEVDSRRGQLGFQTRLGSSPTTVHGIECAVAISRRRFPSRPTFEMLFSVDGELPSIPMDNPKLTIGFGEQWASQLHRCLVIDPSLLDPDHVAPVEYRGVGADRPWANALLALQFQSPSANARTKPRVTRRVRERHHTQPFPSRQRSASCLLRSRPPR